AYREVGSEKRRKMLCCGQAVQEIRRRRSCTLRASYFGENHKVTSDSICSLLERPTRRFISRPSLKRISVGIPRRLKRGEIAGLSSTLILYTLAWPASFSAAASTAGDIARHGPHQGAQKSTRIGSLDW